jgi:hypothetical protein
MLGDAGAVVVFDFIVDGHDRSLGNSLGIRAKAQLCAGLKRRYVLAMKIEREQMRKVSRWG